MKNILYIVICLTLVGTTKMNAQDNNRFIRLSEETIAMFRCSITATNYTFYGLSSEKGLENVTISDPIIHRAVTLRDLAAYSEGQDPKSIIKEMGYVVVPLLRGSSSEVETYVMLNKRDQKYGSTGIGQDIVTQRFLTLQKQSDIALKLVRIPGLNEAFAAFEQEDVLYLSRLTGENRKGAQPQLATVVFTELAKRVPKGEDVPN